MIGCILEVKHAACEFVLVKQSQVWDCQLPHRGHYIDHPLRVTHLREQVLPEKGQILGEGLGEVADARGV